MTDATEPIVTRVNANTVQVLIPNASRSTSTTGQIGLTGLTSAHPTLTRDGVPVADDERLNLRAGDIAKLVQAGALAEAERIYAITSNAAQARAAAAPRRRRKPVPVHLRVNADGRSVAPR